ncbi:MAG: glycosyltransferase [Thermoplasmata archaeon]|nr:glycosyltransferase [Thermoplasmata archaeon]
MLISVVLNLLNEERHVNDLLDSLVVQEGPIEIVVVDAGSVDRTRDIVKEYMERFDFVKLHIKTGTRGESTNYGIKMSGGEAIAFIGGDCIANAFWIKELRRSLAQSDIVAGKTVNIGYYAFADLDRVELFHKGFDLSYPSCNMVFRRKVLIDIGGFDNWFVTAEDIDANFRAVEMGYKIDYNDRAIIYHRTKGGFYSFFKQAFWNGYGRKQLTLKHGHLWSSYNPTGMFKEKTSVLYLARLAVAMLGYISCKFFGKVREREQENPT